MDETTINVDVKQKRKCIYVDGLQCDHLLWFSWFLLSNDTSCSFGKRLSNVRMRIESAESTAIAMSCCSTPENHSSIRVPSIVLTFLGNLIQHLMELSKHIERLE